MTSYCGYFSDVTDWCRSVIWETEIYLSARWCSSPHIRTVSRMDQAELSKFHWEGSVATQLARLESTWLPCLGSDAGEVPMLLSKAKRQERIGCRTAVNLVCLAAREHWQGDPPVQTATKCMCKGRRWALWTFLVSAVPYSNATNGPFQGHTKFVKEYDMNCCNKYSNSDFKIQ